MFNLFKKIKERLLPSYWGFYSCEYCQGPHATLCSSCKQMITHTKNLFVCGCGSFQDGGIWTREEENESI